MKKDIKKIEEKAFLDNYAAHDCVLSKTCEEIGVDEDRVRSYLMSDPIFREASDQIRAENLRKIKTSKGFLTSFTYKLLKN